MKSTEDNNEKRCSEYYDQLSLSFKKTEEINKMSLPQKNISKDTISKKIQVESQDKTIILSCKRLTSKNEEFWKILSSWYRDYDKMIEYKSLILQKNSLLSKQSKFYCWNMETPKAKEEILRKIGEIDGKGNFKKYYQCIFGKENYNQRKLLFLLSKVIIQDSNHYSIEGQYLFKNTDLESPDNIKEIENLTCENLTEEIEKIGYTEKIIDILSDYWKKQ